jgi:hypothetical protein
VAEHLAGSREHSAGEQERAAWLARVGVPQVGPEVDDPQLAFLLFRTDAIIPEASSIACLSDN